MHILRWRGNERGFSNPGPLAGKTVRQAHRAPRPETNTGEKQRRVPGRACQEILQSASRCMPSTPAGCAPGRALHLLTGPPIIDHEGAAAGEAASSLNAPVGYLARRCRCAAKVVRQHRAGEPASAAQIQCAGGGRRRRQRRRCRRCRRWQVCRAAPRRRSGPSWQDAA